MKTTSAYLIHRFPWRDTSYIAQFLTPEGMLSAILKGVRRKKSRLIAGLLPFVPLQLSHSGRTDLKTAIAVESLSPQPALDYVQQACGLYANELIVNLSQATAERRLFDVYHHFMGCLSQSSGVRLEWTLRHFERDLLSACGYGLSLPSELSPQQLADGYLAYLPGRGLQSVPATHTGAVPMIRLQHFLSGKSGSAGDLSALKKLMRTYLDDILGGKKLRSRELLKPLRMPFPPKSA